MHFVAVSLPAQSPSLEQVKEVDFIEIKLPHGIVMRIPAC
jgi:hypothetical protein